jgi:hypothetical protein
MCSRVRGPAAPSIGARRDEPEAACGQRRGAAVMDFLMK